MTQAKLIPDHTTTENASRHVPPGWTASTKKDLYLLLFGLVLVCGTALYIRHRISVLSALEALRQAGTPADVQAVFQQNHSQRIRELCRAKSAELLMDSKEFEKARVFLDHLRKNAHTPEMRFRSGCDYAMSFVFQKNHRQAVSALKEALASAPRQKGPWQFQFLLLLGSELIQCGQYAEGTVYLNELQDLPPSADPKCESARKRGRFLLESLKNRKRK